MAEPTPAQRLAAVADHPAITELRPQARAALEQAVREARRFEDLAPEHQERLVVAERRAHRETHGVPFAERLSNAVGEGFGMVLVGVVAVLALAFVVLLVVDLLGAALTGGVLAVAAAVVVVLVVLFAYLVLAG